MREGKKKPPKKIKKRPGKFGTPPTRSLPFRHPSIRHREIPHLALQPTILLHAQPSLLTRRGGGSSEEVRFAIQLLPVH